MDTSYVGQNKLSSGSDYFIDNIPGDGTTWNPITLPANIRAISVKARNDNDSTLFNHSDADVEFHFAKTATPGVDWVNLLGLNIPITKESGDVLGYVQSAADTYVIILGVE